MGGVGHCEIILSGAVVRAGRARCQADDLAGNFPGLRKLLTRDAGAKLFYRHGHVAQRFFVGFGVSHSALAATKPAQAIPMFTEAADFAVRAVHFDLRFGHRFRAFIY